MTVRALVTGATGFLGRHLVARLEDPVVLSRDPERAKATLGVRQIFEWHPARQEPPLEALSAADVVFHLAGEPLARSRWTQRQRERIRRSRILGTRNLVQGILASPSRPHVLVSASGTGYYGDRGEEELREESKPGTDFFARVCVDWESELQPAATTGIRTVACRIGVVLGNGGGVLPFHLNVLASRFGRVASGEGPWVPWIHLEDVVGLFLHAARTATILGPMNVVAPNGERYLTMARRLADHLDRPVPAAAPYLWLRIRYGRLMDVLRASRRVVPSVAMATRYHFRYPELIPALDELLAERKEAAAF